MIVKRENTESKNRQAMKQVITTIKPARKIEVREDARLLSSLLYNHEVVIRSVRPILSCIDVQCERKSVKMENQKYFACPLFSIWQDVDV